jgi:hypothetical protein
MQLIALIDLMLFMAIWNRLEKQLLKIKDFLKLLSLLLDR